VECGGFLGGEDGDGWGFGTNMWFVGQEVYITGSRLCVGCGLRQEDGLSK